MVKIKSTLNLITYLSVLTICVAIFEYLEPRYFSVFAMLFAVSVYLDRHKVFDIPRWALNSVSILVLTLCFMKIRPNYLIEPILNTLTILIAIKLVEDKKFRDYMQVYALCTFCLFGAALVSFGMIFLLYLSILALCSTVSLMLLAFFSHDPEALVTRRTIYKVVFTSLLICVVSIPTTIVLFFVLPRSSYPLFTFLNRYEYSQSGFSNRVRLGGVSSIQENSSVVFRVQSPRVSQQQLYWRGIVLDRFDGVSWKAGKVSSELGLRRVLGRRVEQVIYIEPYGNRYLFALDKPLFLSAEKETIRGDTGTLTHTLVGGLFKRTRYMATSVLSDFLPQRTVKRERYLQLPEGFSPRIAALVSSLSRDKARQELPGVFMSYLQSGDYQYSLSDLPVSGKPLEDFIFTYRRGNCEYYASALAVMLRMAGIPARLVGGYLGGYYNEAAGYYAVLQSNAHVWVEAYTGGGWKRLDPTPYTADSPSLAYRNRLLVRVRMFLDVVNYYWNSVIIGYDFEQQLRVVRTIRRALKKPNLKSAVRKEQAMYLVLVVATVLIVLTALRSFKQTRKTKAEKLIAGFHHRMGRHGYRRGPGEGLEEFVARIEAGELRDKAAAFVNDFQDLFYRDIELTRTDVQRFEARLRDL